MKVLGALFNLRSFYSGTTQRKGEDNLKDLCIKYFIVLREVKLKL